MLDSRMVSMGVLSNDFAAVDLREELCYHSRPEKRKFKRCNERQKPMKESHARRKSGSRSPSGLAGTATRRRAFGLVFLSFLCLLLRGVCLAAASAASRACLCQAHATVPTVTFLAMSEERNHILSCSIFSKLRCKIRICLRQSGDRRK